MTINSLYINIHCTVNNYEIENMQLTKLSQNQIRDKIVNLLTNNLPEGLVEAADIQEEQRIGEWTADLTSTLMTASGVRIPIIVEIKDTQRLRDLREAMQQVKELARSIKASPMVAGIYWGDRARRVAKEEQVGLLDLAGNFYLQKDPVLIEKTVAKNPFQKTSPLKNLFSPVSTRIVRALLIEPDRKWRLLELAEVTRVSIGLTYKVVDRLVAEEFGKRTKEKQFILTSPKELLDAWAGVYQKDQNQKLVYYSFEKDQNTLIRLVEEASKKNNTPCAFGYFSGALMVAPFIRGFQKVQFFVKSPEDVEAFKKELNLQSVESGGNVDIFVPYDEGVFYEVQNIDGLSIVSNVQLYLDLIHNPARGKEQAEYLRESKLKF